MSAESTPEARLASLINEAFDDEIVTHWVMVAEVINPDAQTLRVWTSEGSSRWLIRGMLSEAEDMVIGDEYEEQLFIEEDNDDEA